MIKRSFRSSASFGKRQEYVAVAELLRRGFDVYMTLVDDQQIDCIIRQELNSQLRYVDIQIKARSNLCVQKDGGFFPAMHIRRHIFSPSSLSFINASALPRASST